MERTAIGNGDYGPLPHLHRAEADRSGRACQGRALVGNLLGEDADRSTRIEQQRERPRSIDPSLDEDAVVAAKLEREHQAVGADPSVGLDGARRWR